MIWDSHSGATVFSRRSALPPAMLTSSAHGSYTHFQLSVHLMHVTLAAVTIAKSINSPIMLVVNVMMRTRVTCLRSRPLATARRCMFHGYARGGRTLRFWENIRGGTGILGSEPGVGTSVISWPDVPTTMPKTHPHFSRPELVPTAATVYQCTKAGILSSPSMRTRAEL